MSETEQTAASTIPDDMASLSGESLDMPSRDIIKDLYYFVISEQSIKAHELTIGCVIQALRQQGILFWRDGRYKDSQVVALNLVGIEPPKYSNKVSSEIQEKVEAFEIGYTEFAKLIAPCARLFLKTFSEENVIPDWSGFCTDMAYHYAAAKSNTSGENAQYIPILKEA